MGCNNAPLGRSKVGFIFPIKCPYCFQISKIRLFLKPTNSRQPTKKQILSKTTLGSPGTPSPAVRRHPLSAVSVPCPQFSPSDSQGRMTWAGQAEVTTSCPQSAAGHLQECFKGGWPGLEVRGGGRAEKQQVPVPSQGTRRERRGCGRGAERDTGLEPAHGQPAKQAATGISGARLLKPSALPQGRGFGLGSVILTGAFARSQKSSTAFQDALRGEPLLLERERGLDYFLMSINRAFQRKPRLL